MNNQNLFLALCEEHKQRTGHDIFTMRQLDIARISCGVCTYLGAIKRERQKDFDKYIGEQAVILENEDPTPETGAGENKR